ncbi:MAG: hypothetical protein PWP54_294 [Thermosipho sp. (in: thermotogales)]|nr:hypothetical protein [Thermosipho sp. (in: thermotogales)]MDN5324818.1 hypothetical protein [Thermosipho sp. (in: thermotogales)]
MLIGAIGITFSILISIIFVVKSKNIYERLIPLLSISTKMSLLLMVLSYIYNLQFIFEVGIFYLLLSIGGSFIIASFISRSDF